MFEKKSRIAIRGNLIAWKRWQGRLWELIEVTNLQPWKSSRGWGRIYERLQRVKGRRRRRWWSLLISWSRTSRCAWGGGEPSLASREDPYGSLRMPLSICVILRIYNEDAIHFPSYSSRDTRCSVFLSLPLPSPFPRSPTLLRLSHPFHLSRAWTIQRARRYLRHRYHIASIGQLADELMSHDVNYCRATQDDHPQFRGEGDNSNYGFMSLWICT